MLGDYLSEYRNEERIGMNEGIKIYYVCVPTSHKECKHHVLPTHTNKNRVIRSKNLKIRLFNQIPYPTSNISNKLKDAMSKRVKDLGPQCCLPSYLFPTEKITYVFWWDLWKDVISCSKQVQNISIFAIHRYIDSLQNIFQESRTLKSILDSFVLPQASRN